MEPVKKKIFVLDTNVLMHDPSSVFRFEEHDLFIPMVVLEELDGLKKGTSDAARTPAIIGPGSRLPIGNHWYPGPMSQRIGALGAVNSACGIWGAKTCARLIRSAPSAP